ncbi:phage tail protein [Persicimonas caeni]|uniref:Phage tail protein n=1 Tax=Persicimonas caeni TaxID=2292766 RepID=A0A4Y6PWX0_PERCE|nr:phage tail protein [Persicimonas caeni]QDG52255.1 phage tail protein [Persicimonas caeni]QED33477.1 phage tail protein [Persicimonas caeni]
MAVGERIDPYAQFSFIVRIDGVDVAGFTEASGFVAESDVIEYREGSDEHTMRKLPGLLKYNNISLKRGITNNDALWKWRKTTLDGQTQRRDGAIVLRDEAGNEVIAWSFRAGWIAKYEGATLDAKSSEVAVETIEIAHEGLDYEVL